MNKILSGIATVSLLVYAGCSPSQSRTSTAEDQAPPPPEPSRVTEVPVPAVTGTAAVSSAAAGPIGLGTVSSPWHIFSANNHPGEDDLITTVSENGTFNLIVRQHGSKLECYLSASSTPDEMEAAPKRRSLVKYKFDDGPQIKEQWPISVNATSLQYPGDTLQFIETIRKSQRLEMEISRSGDSLDSEVFNLGLFPDGLIAALPKTR